ncbi:sugar hydrolase [Streptomyces sp. P38-E01]|uniref:Sugar hydrolase n=1 Tax=Streptomyces tardus TaxID=2780544 RepID=A0A949JCK7_9ACTN|nr:glycoside hydrolase family 64 protein [Streptomyces tardus]MBU7597578.1 sugar hydrolase [Streptomyces tardus]
MRAKKKLLATLAAAAVVGAGFTAFDTSTTAEAAAADTIPLTFKNDSGTDEQIYIYTIGTNLATGEQGYADADGNFTAWPGGGNPPTEAPDASFEGPAAGESMDFQLPKFSGRVYYSYGEKLTFKLAEGGLVQPAVQNPDDPNANTLFNWTEYTLNDSGLWINSTQVDMFSAPYSVGVDGSDGSSQTTGVLKAGAYKEFFNKLESVEGWGGLVKKREDGTPLRALSPGHGIGIGDIPEDTMSDYVDRVWEKYKSDTLTVTPFGHEPDTKYFGKVNGDKMDFTDGSGEVVTSFEKPDSDSIFGCHKQLDAPNDEVRGPLSRTLCAGFHRTTLLTNSDQPDSSPDEFYKDEVTNEYAKLVHEAMEDGKAYAFAFDDVANHESLVHDGDPQKAYITLQPFD